MNYGFSTGSMKISWVLLDLDVLRARDLHVLNGLHSIYIVLLNKATCDK